MDLRTYYKKIREAEATLHNEYVVLVSMATPEGGKDGVLTEAPRTVAAKVIAEGRARLATEEESERFYEDASDAKLKYDQDEAAKRVQVMVIPASELQKRDRS